MLCVICAAPFICQFKNIFNNIWLWHLRLVFFFFSLLLNNLRVFQVKLKKDNNRHLWTSATLCYKRITNNNNSNLMKAESIRQCLILAIMSSMRAFFQFLYLLLLPWCVRCFMYFLSTIYSPVSFILFNKSSIFNQFQLESALCHFKYSYIPKSKRADNQEAINWHAIWLCKRRKINKMKEEEEKKSINKLFKSHERAMMWFIGDIKHLRDTGAAQRQNKCSRECKR